MRSRKKTPSDINALAAHIVQQVTAEPAPVLSEAEVRSQAAKMLGRLGGLKGGKARAKALSPERRREIALKAIRARWKGKRKK